jgi:hypothetical protein
MTQRTTIFPLLICLLFALGCVRHTKIYKEYWTTDELEKVQAVKVFMEEKDFNERSYKVIKKVQGYSSLYDYDSEKGHIPRDKAVEQLKIYTVRAGGNAIANIVCIIGRDERLHIKCEADAILLDNYDEDGNPIKNDEFIPKAIVEEDCDPGMESCN